MDQEMLLSRLQKEHAVIFGTGFVARMFWHALLQHRLEGRITAFLESDPRPGRTYQGLPVISAFSDAADHNSLVCLAVHESIAGEMKEKLQDAGFSCVVWIAPLLCDLLYGPPLAAGLVDVNEILDSQDPDENWIALRYGAMRDYYRQTADYAFAGEVYCRAIALHCGYETAKKRALAMERLADSVKQNGFDPEHPVCIDENKCIIDGLHRFAAAVCCGRSSRYFHCSVSITPRISALNFCASRAALPINSPSICGWTMSSLALPGLTLPPYSTGIVFPASPNRSIRQFRMTICISSA